MRTSIKHMLMAFAVPVAILLGVYVVWGQYPFGDESLLIWDMNWQYASFFSHLHDILHGNASAFYTFSRAFGGNMLSVSAYYLISPFNLIFYFTDAEHIYIGILIVTLLKTGCTGMTMYRFLCRKREDVAAIIFSTAYALSAYMIGYLFNIFWIDSLILLPCIIGAIENLVDNGKFLLYTLLLSLAIITNFYMGYMICLFSVLYFLYYFFAIPGRIKICRTFLLYFLSSLLGGMLSMWLILPLTFTLLRGKGSFSLTSLFDFHRIFQGAGLIDSMFCATTGSTPITNGNPLIYCGILPLLMTVCWVIHGKDSVRSKILYLLLSGFILFSFNHYNLNCVWHAFNYPTGSPHRFAFLYIFLLLYAAYKGCKTIREQTISKITIPAAGIFLIFLLLCRTQYFAVNISMTILILNIGLVVIYTFLISLPNHRRFNIYCAAGLLFLELFINAENLYRQCDQYDSAKISEYQAYMKAVLPLIEQSKKDSLPHRTVMCKKAFRTPNDSFMFNLYGLDSYTSVEERRISKIADNFGYGYSDSILWGIRYDVGSYNSANALLSVKYLISNNRLNGRYVEIDCEDEMKLYKNENALPFAVLADQSILELQHTELPSFQYINKLYHSLDSHQNEDIFHPLPGSCVTVYHCTEQPDGSICATDQAVDAYVEYEYTTIENCAVYVSYNDSGITKAEVFIGEEKTDLSEQLNNVKTLGDFAKGTKIKIRYYIKEQETLRPHEIYVCGESQKLLDAYTTHITKHAPEITMHTDAHISISCENETNKTAYILCSIPWERGWHVMQDGIKADAPLSIQNLLVIPITPGNHNIELKYIPQGFIAGLILSIFGAVILSVLCTNTEKTYYNSP